MLEVWAPQGTAWTWAGGTWIGFRNSRTKKKFFMGPTRNYWNYWIRMGRRKSLVETNMRPKIVTSLLLSIKYLFHKLLRYSIKNIKNRSLLKYFLLLWNKRCEKHVSVLLFLILHMVFLVNFLYVLLKNNFLHYNNDG